ncbi:DUF1127 domain-containing protein [Methylobacterium sp. ID0610]|uniref:DUF1127 domain-containing protein n=1 Tax=Methylobacterium carpenticola TaxID=3344827 RepID=UPI0036C7DB0D
MAVVVLRASRRSAVAQPSPPRPGRPAIWRLWLWRSRTRRELADLSPEQLRDVGLSPAAVRAELRKPFWRP